jgi:site-specific recombinase XerD
MSILSTLPANVSPQLSQAIRESLEAKRSAKRSQRYLDSLRRYLGAFARGREQSPVCRIGLPELEQWFSSRNEAPQSRNSNLGRLSAFFSYAWRRGYVRENRCFRFEKASIETRAPAVLSNEQCRLALDFVAAEWPKYLGWFVLALFAGLRPEAEADFITWEDIDLAHGRLIVTKSKVKAHRIIDMNMIPNAAVWLGFAKANGSQFGFCRKARERFLKKVRDRLGFKAWPQDILRHTAASNLLAIHQDAGKVANLLGHSAGILLRRYKSLIVKENAEQFFNLLPK